MKKYRSYWFYLLLVLSISLTIIVINNSNSHVIPPIIQDINSGVIGAILTTIITLLLLSNQTESQENLTKSSVVYEEKLKIFNHFIDTIGSCLEDGKFTAQETTKIIHSFSILRIHISVENSRKLERAISSIDNSFFFFDENNIPNLDKIVALYTEITNVFRHELYGEGANIPLEIYDLNNLKNVLYRKRTSPIHPKDFPDLLDKLQQFSKVLHTTKTGITIVYDINEELKQALSLLHEFMVQIASEIDEEILFNYEIKKHIINNENFSGIPWIKLHFRGMYFAHFGITETKRLWVGKNIPEVKQIASFEIFEMDKLADFRYQINKELEQIILSLKSS